MKTLVRLNIASIMCLALLAACAPSKRSATRQVAPVGGAGSDKSQATGILTPLPSGVARAEAVFPVEAGKGGTITLVEAQPKDNAVITLDANGANPTVAELNTAIKVSAENFVCTHPGAGSPLSQCTDGQEKINLTGADGKLNQILVSVLRRAQMSVALNIFLPNDTNKTSSPDFAPTWGTAYYVGTTVTDGSKNTDGTDANRSLDTVYISGPKTDASATAVDSGALKASESQQIRFVILTGVPKTDKAGNVLTLQPGDKALDAANGVVDKSTSNLVKNFSVQMPDKKTLKTMTMTVAKWTDTTATTLAGSPDLSSVTSDQVSSAAATAPAPATAAASGNNSAPSTPSNKPAPSAPAPAPASGNTPAAPAAPAAKDSGSAPTTAAPAAPSAPAPAAQTAPAPAPVAPASGNAPAAPVAAAPAPAPVNQTPAASGSQQAPQASAPVPVTPVDPAAVANAHQQIISAGDSVLQARKKAAQEIVQARKNAQVQVAQANAVIKANQVNQLVQDSNKLAADPNFKATLSKE